MLENELKDLQGKLAELVKTLEAMPADEANYLHHFAFISNIGASTRIENAALTDQEVEWVDTTLIEDGKTTAFEQYKTFILEKLSKDRERSVEEVVGCRHMLATVYLQAKELFPLTESSVRGLHHDLLRYYPRADYHAGGYKNSPNRVIFINHQSGEERIVLDPAPPGIATQTAMADLVDWYNRTLRDYTWPVLIATEFVFRFLAIHPFQDGNGRLGRALFILSLLQSNDRYWERITPFIAIDRHIEQNRSLYYTTLQRAAEGKFSPDSSTYDLEPVAWFFIKILNACLSDIDIYRKRYARLKKLSETAQTVLNIFKGSPENRLKVADIVRTTGLPRRTVQYTLRILTNAEILQKLGQGAGTRYQLLF